MLYLLAFIVTVMIAVPWVLIMAIPVMVLFGSPFVVVMARSRSVYSVQEQDTKVSLLVLEDGEFPAVPLVNALAERHFINLKKVDTSLMDDRFPASEIVDVLKDEKGIRELADKIPILYYKDTEAKYGELEAKQ